MSRFEVTAGGELATEVVVGPGQTHEPVLRDRSGRRQVVVLTQPGIPRSIADRVITQALNDVRKNIRGFIALNRSMDIKVLPTLPNELNAWIYGFSMSYL